MYGLAAVYHGGGLPRPEFWWLLQESQTQRYYYIYSTIKKLNLTKTIHIKLIVKKIGIARATTYFITFDCHCDSLVYIR